MADSSMLHFNHELLHSFQVEIPSPNQILLIHLLMPRLKIAASNYPSLIEPCRELPISLLVCEDKYRND
jgi:hypothetical protein